MTCNIDPRLEIMVAYFRAAIYYAQLLTFIRDLAKKLFFFFFIIFWVDLEILPVWPIPVNLAKTWTDIIYTKRVKIEYIYFLSKQKNQYIYCINNICPSFIPFFSLKRDGDKYITNVLGPVFF